MAAGFSLWAGAKSLRWNDQRLLTIGRVNATSWELVGLFDLLELGYGYA